MNYQSLTKIPYSASLILEMQEHLLPIKRFEHVKRVTDTALKIVKLTNKTELTNKVETASLLHDFAKGMSSDELYEYAKIHKISLGDVPPPVYHAVVGTWMAENFFTIHDKDVLNAILFHTTGHVSFDQNPVGQILFLADYLEPERNIDRDEIEKYLTIDLNKAIALVVREKLIHVLKKNLPIAPESLEFYHFLLKKIN